MENAKRPGSKDAKNAASNTSARTNKNTVQSRTAGATVTLTESPSSNVDVAFKEDDKLRAVFTKHLAARAKDSFRIAERASKAFENFLPSTFTSAEREARNYLAPGENLPQAMNGIVKKGVAAMKETSEKRALRIYVDGALENLVTTSPGGGSTFRQIPFDGLNKLLMRLLADVPTLTNDPTRAACDAKAKATKLLAEIEGTEVPATRGTPLVEGPGATDNGSTSSVKQFVNKHVNGLLANVASPEEELLYVVNERATLKDAETNVDSFQLRKGASDVTSYHDFRSLHIAFEHIWTEIFDGKLKSLGMALYHEAIKLEDFLQPGGKKLPPAITSKAELLKLLGAIRELSDVAADSMPDNGSIIVKNPWSHSDPLHISKPFQVVIDKSDDAADSAEPGKPPPVPTIPGAPRLSLLLDEIERRLNEGYSFHVFADRSVNFGMMVTYRQTWRPESYQVGDLVSTIPLAPREVRRYTTKRVVKKTRTVKEVEDSLRTTRSDTSGTSRVDRQIVDSAQDKTNFDVTTRGAIGGEGEGYEASATAKVGGEHATQSENTKKHFHEAVLKSAMEYKQQHRMEIDTTASEETEETTFHEIQNPNDELTVTYMFYELQRTYRISEKIHQLTPVVLVANEVPAPDGIDDAWLTTHDWIIRRVLLDDSFKPALEYLTKSFIGAEINLQILTTNAKAQKQVADKLKQQIELQTKRIEIDETNLANTVKRHADAKEIQGAVNEVARIFDPLGITGKKGEGAISAGETMVDYLQETFDRAEREKARLLDQLGIATTALQVAIDKLSAATKEHFDRIAEIDRLRLHVKQNILYYMQAIWSHEPPDQRFFRVYNIEVQVPVPDTANMMLPIKVLPTNVVNALRGREKVAGVSLEIPPFTIEKKKLVEIADLDTVLGYKGNYAIYALNENNFVTLNMMQDYLEVSDVVKLRDPDEFGNYTVEDLKQLAECIRKDSPATYDDYRNQFRDLIIERLTSGRAEDDRVIVPTDALYIEALVGTHPLLEDFKLIHRALDVKKVQAEVRHAELENIRLAARALKGEREDPDIEKKIVIETDTKSLTIQPDGN